MRVPRVYVAGPLSVGERLTLPPGPASHLRQVLRLGEGDPLRLFDGSGQDYAAEILTVGRSGILVAVGPAGEPEAEPALRIRLALGVSKGDRMDYALQKAVELGASALVPLFTERSLVRLEGTRLERRLAHWQGIVVGACEQSGRRRLPTLEPAARLEDWLARPPEVGLLLDPSAPEPLAGGTCPGPDLTLLVGPEGGLSRRERELAMAAGFRGVRLGPRVLRAETAPLAAIAVLQALWGDLRDAPREALAPGRTPGRTPGLAPGLD